MIRRFQSTEVLPLELFDVVVDGHPLYRHPRNRDFLSRLARVANLVRRGAAKREGGARPLAGRPAFETVVLTGGAVPAEPWPGPLPARRLPGCAEAGGRAILSQLSREGAVVDLGQSRLKGWWQKRAIDVPRIPLPTGPQARERLTSFVAESLSELCAGSVPDTLVLALPCEVSANGTLGECSYPWSRGDRTLVPEIAQKAGLADVVILNDAELAALGARAVFASTAPALVLTVGWGVGAALLRGHP
ncbi:MAG TPA: hypothetical protein VMB50_00155 [Myxococcales bacterium]|nr:hypothetical protein [Myxococcales bacterium]